MLVINHFNFIILVELPNLLVDARRVDPSTMKQVLYLDTLAVAKMLEKHGNIFLNSPWFLSVQLN